MPAIYISKYNRFVDNVIGRINRVLGKSYDPVRVKMPTTSTKNNKAKGKKGNAKGKGNGKGKGQKKKNNTRRTNNKIKTVRESDMSLKSKMEEIPIARSSNDISQERLIGMYLLH